MLLLRLPARGVELVAQPCRSLQPPRLGDQLGQVVAINSVEVDQDRTVSVVVGSRVERRVPGGQQRLLLVQLAHEHQAAFGLGAQPGKALAAHLQRRCAVRRRLLGLGQCGRDGHDVVPGDHRYPLDRWPDIHDPITVMNSLVKRESRRAVSDVVRYDVYSSVSGKVVAMATMSSQVIIGTLWIARRISMIASP